MDGQATDDPGHPHRATWTRREFLHFAGIGGATALIAPALAGCGTTSHPTGTSTPGTSKATTGSATTPRRGGTLRVGLTGGASSDTLDGQNIITPPDVCRCLQLYDSLLEPTNDNLAVPALAESVTPNNDASEWTIRLRSGVTFHNGKDLTADDVIFSLQRIINPKHPLPDATTLRYLRFDGFTKLDTHTVRIDCTAPFASLGAILGNQILTLIVPVGFDPKHPVGTGPFKYESFEPGVRSVFTRNENYWQVGRPYADEVVIIDFPDETSQINALLSGQIDLAGALTASSLSEVRGSGAGIVVSLNGADYVPFTMRVDQPPFNDVRVRLAMRLVVDRPQMRDVVFGGYGVIGNDVLGIYDPTYDRALPQREQDIEQAKFLLKKAGREDLTCALTTSDIAQGAPEMATVLKQQASAAGITITLQQEPVSSFYGPNYLKWNFAQDYYAGFAPYLVAVGQSFVAGAPYDECHFDEPRYNQLFAAAQAQPDEAKRAPIVHEMCQIDYDSGGYIVPLFIPVLDAHAQHVQGLEPSKTGLSLMGANLKDLWID